MMTPEEVKSAVKEGITETLGQFAVDRETHWEDHKFVGDLRRLLDMSRAETCKGIVRWGVRVIITLILIGFAVSRGFFGAKP